MPLAPSAPPPSHPPHVAIIGGGPAGLMAAEVLAAGGVQIDLYDAMPSVGRKFLLAGKGGLNLTHSEPLAEVVARYGERAEAVAGWLADFGPLAVRDWALGLGISTFVGTSGRVFPAEMKAAPLLRAWLHRLRAAGVRFHSRHRWVGWAPGEAATTLRFSTPAGEAQATADAVVLALGGASWPQLGSNGAWVETLAQRQVDVAPLRPANCGFDVAWSPFFAEHFAGAPLKSVALHFDDGRGMPFHRQGEFVVTAGGVEGSLIYAASARLRDAIEAHGQATLQLDLVPGRSEAAVAQALARGRGTASLAKHLKAHLGIEGVKAALLREGARQEELTRWLAESPLGLAQRLKAWPVTLLAPRPVAEAISTAGGVRLEALDDGLMLRHCPGVFCAGEMLDWEAPTGGYLLTACLASGVAVGRAAMQHLRSTAPKP
jgi:uncharacterized flavoprotein (TIGR03862 family)